MLENAESIVIRDLDFIKALEYYESNQNILTKMQELKLVGATL